MEIELCTHCPIQELDKKRLTEIFKSYKDLKCPAEIHKDKSKPAGHPREYWTCLKCYETLCGRSVATQCMIKHWEDEGLEHCVVVSPLKKMIWYVIHA